MILNLRGTSGSGKSYVGKRFIEHFECEELFEPNFGKKVRKPVAYKLPGEMYVVGRYDPKIRGGGAEGFTGQTWIWRELVRHFATVSEGAHVFVEGLMHAAAIHPWHQLMTEIDRPRVFAYLDTTIDQCIEAVIERTGGTGISPRGKPINQQAIREHHALVWRTKRRFDELGEPTMWIPRATSFRSVVEVYAQEGWSPGLRWLEENEGS